MKSPNILAGSMLFLGCLASLAAAQDAPPAAIVPPVVPMPVPASAALTQPSVVNLDPHDVQPYHMYGDVGLGVYSIHGLGAGTGSGTLLGTGGSVNIVGEHLGAGIGWFDGTQSFNHPGGWSVSHRP